MIDCYARNLCNPTILTRLSSTGHASYFLFYGCEPKLPNDLLLSWDGEEAEIDGDNLYEWTDHYRRLLYTLARGTENPCAGHISEHMLQMFADKPCSKEEPGGL